MEKENYSGTEGEYIFTLMKQAQLGDEQSMIQLLDIFKPQMEKQVKMMRMQKEDAMQSLKLGLIMFIKDFNRC